jgi:hypothetical protein
MADPDKFLKERAGLFSRLAISIILDASLFVLWLGLAWLMERVSTFVKDCGCHEFCAEIFKWASSGGTLALTLLYITGDVKGEYDRIFKTPKPKELQEKYPHDDGQTDSQTGDQERRGGRNKSDDHGIR